MKQFVLIPLLAAGLVLGACSDGSSLPDPTGKASITAINAIPGSPDINFLIEERGIGSISYQSASAGASYDDLDYTFNFEAFFAGNTQFTRIASRHIDFVKDMHYTLLASGNLNKPDITLWETPERDFDGTETVFQVRFAHASAQLGAIDIYFAADGVAPVLGEQAATVSFGEISAPIDYEAGEYVVTVTASGDETAILHQSFPSTLLAGSELIILPFDPDENDNSPLVVRGLSHLGGAITFSDPQFPATVQYLNAAREMGTTNIYDDELLTSQVLSDHEFRQLTVPVEISEGVYDYFYEPVSDPGMTTLSTAFTAGRDGNYRVVAIGSGGTYSTTNFLVDRRSELTSARMNIFNSTTNFDFTDIYIVDRDATIDETIPFRRGLISRAPGSALDVLPGSYDLYMTDFQGTEPIAGPFPLDLEFGDVIDLVVFDTDDPAVLEIVDFTGQ